MEYKICTICGKTKKITRYYTNRNQCKRCYIAKRKYTTLEEDDGDDDNIQDVNNIMQNLDISSPLHAENVELRQDLGELRKEIQSMNMAMSYYQQITAKLENTMQEVDEKTGLISAENTKLQDKVGSLEIENTKLRSNVEMSQHHMDSMDENILRIVSMSEDLCNKTRDLEEFMGVINGKVDNYRKMQLELGNAYYQFIMGNLTNHGVKKRLNNAGYLQPEKQSNVE
jgi:chromosome segregation ATPase